MSDTTATQTAPKPWTPQSTLNAATSLTGLAIMAQYINDCFTAGHLVNPGLAVIGVILTAVSPVAHIMGNIVMNHLRKLEQESEK